MKYIVGGLIFVGIFLLWSGFYALSKNLTQNGKFKTFWARVRARAAARQKQEWALFGALIISYSLLYYSWPEEFLYILKNFWILLIIDHFVLFIAYFFLRNEKGKIHGGATIALIILFAVNIHEVWIWYGEYSLKQAAVNSNPAFKNGRDMGNKHSALDNSTAETSSCLMPLNVDGRREVIKILDAKFPSTDPATIHDKKKLLWIPWHETRFNHVDAQGHVYHRCPTPDNPDTSPSGINQIKPLWKPLCLSKGLDYEKSLSDNEYCKFEIYLKLKSQGKTGFEAWPSVPDDETVLDALAESPSTLSSSTLSKLKIDGDAARRIAPPMDAKGQWSEKLTTTRTVKFYPEAPIFVRNNHGVIIPLNPGEEKDLGPSSYMEFQSQSKEPVVVHVQF